MSGINITIDGKEMSLEEYLLEEEKKRKKDFGEQATNQFATHSGEYAFAAGVGQRKQHYSEPEPTGKKRVTYSKRYSTKEIKEMEEMEMKSNKETRELLLKGLMQHEGQWMTPVELGQSMGLDLNTRKDKLRWHSAVSKLLQYLVQEELVSKKKDPAGGRGSIYLFKAEVKHPEAEIPLLEERYMGWMRNVAANKRAAARGEESISPPETQVEEAPVVTAQAPVEVEKRDIERLVNLAQNATLTVLVKVEVKFGLLK